MHHAFLVDPKQQKAGRKPAIADMKNEKERLVLLWPWQRDIRKLVALPATIVPQAVATASGGNVQPTSTSAVTPRIA